MYRSTLLLLALCGSLVVSGASAQSLPVELYLDYAPFVYSEEENLLELYLAVGAATLDYTEREGSFTASLPLSIALRPTASNAPAGVNEDAVYEQETELTFSVADTMGLDQGQYFVEMFRTVVPPGEYALTVVAPADAEMGRPEVALQLDPMVPSFEQRSGTQLSGIMLASSIERGEEGGRFVKSGLEVVPNPNGLYGAGQDQVFYYAEAYNLPGDADDYTLLAYISETNQPTPVAGFERRTSRPVASPDVLIGRFAIDTLPSGSYFLHLVALDENNEALAEQSKKFFVFNPDVEQPNIAVDEGFETSFYAVMGAEEVTENLQHARIIASARELEQMKRLESLDAQREFLAAFWQRRDPDSNPSTNPARRDFYERLRFAEDRYETAFREAYETDRGRILLKYGYPAEVTPNPFSQNLVPHEIWRYENIPGEGRAEFVFADRDGTSEYRLIHGTTTGEVSAPDWQRQLQR